MALIFDHKIIKITSMKDFDSDNTNIETVIDAKNNFVLPGFIDVHIHGLNNVDTMDNSIESILKLKKDVTKNGVTSFLPTTMTMDINLITAVLENIRSVMTHEHSGANVLGAHMEGPFISPKYKGAQSSEHIICANFELVESFKDVIKVLTIAPETENAIELIEKYSKTINFSIGHTNANSDTVLSAIKSGAKSFTHLFNAMTPLAHREIGAVGSALISDSYVELIADNFHVSSLLYDFIIKNKGIDKLILITDSIRATNLEDGVYNLGGQNVFVRNGKCFLENDTIAGSTLKLNEALKNFTENSSLDLKESIKLVTVNPAKYLNVYDKVGSIEVHKNADIVIMDDMYNILETIVGGVIEYEI